MADSDNNNNDEDDGDVIPCWKQECVDTIERLFTQYKDNRYMIQRLHTHVVTHLPTTLKNEAHNHEKRTNLTSHLTEEMIVFAQVFLNRNKYYYLPHDEYYRYDGINYTIVPSANEVAYNIQTAISCDRTLLSWKPKTKNYIMRLIRERSLFSSIPERETIQQVLNALCPSLFATRCAAKYFLTVIGDNILKKNKLIFLAYGSDCVGTLCTTLATLAATRIGSNYNVIDKIVTKYHPSRPYELTRFLKFNGTDADWSARTFQQNPSFCLNMFCVAVHYSNRYQNSDAFLQTCPDETLASYALTLYNAGTPVEIVRQFVSTCIEFTDDETMIDWRNMHFIWKQHLALLQWPNVIVSWTLKSLLAEQLNYDPDNDVFRGVTSRFLPHYNKFIAFWNTTIVSTPPPSHASSSAVTAETEEENDAVSTTSTVTTATLGPLVYLPNDVDHTNANIDTNANFNANNTLNQLEIDEICFLFKHWNNDKTNLNESTVITIIRHFFPHISIVNRNFVNHVTCTLWNKGDHIRESVAWLKRCNQTNTAVRMMSFDDMYAGYQTYCSTNHIKWLVNKGYFERFLLQTMADTIVHERNDCLFVCFFEKKISNSKETTIRPQFYCMRHVFQTFVFQLLCILVFGSLYWMYKDDFSLNIVNDKKKELNMLDCFFTSVTVQAGVGYSILNPNTDRAVAILMVQQLCMVFANILILYCFSMHMLSKR